MAHLHYGHAGAMVIEQFLADAVQHRKRQRRGPWIKVEDTFHFASGCRRCFHENRSLLCKMRRLRCYRTSKRLRIAEVIQNPHFRKPPRRGEAKTKWLFRYVSASTACV